MNGRGPALFVNSSILHELFGYPTTQTFESFVKMAQTFAIPALQQKMKNLLELVQASPFFNSKFFRRRKDIRFLFNKIAFELMC